MFMEAVLVIMQAAVAWLMLARERSRIRMTVPACKIKLQKLECLTLRFFWQ